MKENDTTLWGIHGGKTGEADALFLRGNVIALGWSKVGDLKGLLPLRRVYIPEAVEATAE